LSLVRTETFDVLELKDGRVFERNSAIQLIKQRNVGRVWSFRDITQRRRAQDALANEKRVLQEIASGAPLATVLDVLVRGVEAQSCDGMMCTVLVFDEAAQCLRHGAAPSMPAEYNRIVDGIGIGRVSAHVEALLTSVNRVCDRYRQRSSLGRLRRTGCNVRTWFLLFDTGLLQRWDTTGYGRHVLSSPARTQCA
jgi:hypothetical protein